GRGASHGRATASGSRALVAAQIAFAVVLLVGAGLLTRTFLSLLHTNLGYAATTHEATFQLNMQGRYRYPAEREQFLNAFFARLHAVPGVESIGWTAVGPWQGGWRSVGFRIEGRSVVNGTPPSIELATASRDFFATTGIRVERGRVFNAGDRPGAPPVIVISESVAKRFWPNASPIGARVYLDGGITDSTIANEIVGVVADVRPSVTDDFMSTVYLSAEQGQFFGNEFVVRTTGDAAALIPTIRQDLHTADSRLPLANPRTLRDVLGASIERQQLAMAMTGAFALLALLLAALGVYGIMAYAVVARTREFGIRTALGASRGGIMLLVLRHGLVTAIAGSACGLVVAALASKLLASLLSG
ncbi:MAG: ABC transporter permease, partial [Gemmatimonadaceae bacterium]